MSNRRFLPENDHPMTTLQKFLWLFEAGPRVWFYNVMEVWGGRRLQSRAALKFHAFYCDRFGHGKLVRSGRLGEGPLVCSACQRPSVAKK